MTKNDEKYYHSISVMHLSWGMCKMFFCSDLWIMSDFLVYFSKLPVFFKLCQDGVWGVRKVSHTFWQRLIVFVHPGILKLNYTVLTDTVFVLVILQRLVQNVTWVYQLQAQDWCEKMNCHNSSLVCCVTSQDGFVLLFLYLIPLFSTSAVCISMLKYL